MSFSSTLQMTLSLSVSLMYTSMYAFEYFVNLNGVWLNAGFCCGNWTIRAKYPQSLTLWRARWAFSVEAPRTIESKYEHQKYCTGTRKRSCSAQLMLWWVHPYNIEQEPYSPENILNMIRKKYHYLLFPTILIFKRPLHLFLRDMLIIKLVPVKNSWTPSKLKIPNQKALTPLNITSQTSDNIHNVSWRLFQYLKLTIGLSRLVWWRHNSVLP